MIGFVGILNLLGLAFWVLLMLFLYGMGGGHPWNPTVLFLYCGGLAYFALSFVSTLPFVKTPWMRILGILANVALLPMIITGIASIEVLYFGVPFAILTTLWYFAYRKRRARELPDAPA